MAKNSKLELKKEYMNKLLFKDDDKLVVYKLFIHKDVLITTEKFKINREGVASYQCEPKELTNKSAFVLKYVKNESVSLVNYKTKENIFKLININSTKDGNKTITKTLSTSIKLDEVPYWGYVLMNKSYPPILILDTDPTVKEKNPLELIKNDQCKINSLREKMTIKTETKVTEVTKCNCTPIGVSFENYYVNSSYSKEDIKYDDNGEVIYYRNDINKVKFYVEDNYKLTFVDGVLVNMIYCDPKDKVLVTEFLGKQIISKLLDATNSSTICDGKAHNYYKNGKFVDFTSDSSYIYKPEFKRPHINSINTDTGIVDYFVDNHIFCKELKNNNKDEQESIITTKYYDSDCNILMVHSPDTFKSKSGVNYRWTYNSDKYVYSDNDIQAILDNACQLIDYKHNLLSNQKYVYIRDNFGVPFKFADLEVD